MNVTTINGEEILKKEARKIKNLLGEWKYYKIGNINKKDSGNCYQINNIYYTIDKGRVVWDNRLCRYVLKTSTIQGIINEQMEDGFFSLDDSCTTGYVSRDIKKHFLNETILNNLNYIQGNHNVYFNPEVFTYKEIFPRAIIANEFKNSLDYNFKNYLEKCKLNFKSFVPKINNDVELFHKSCKRLLNNYTFGVELETTRGMIPESVYKTLGVMPVRDGSISGLEYVTIPLTGKKGLYALKEIVEAVNKYTDSDYTCSMHIHVGNIPRTMEFINSMFKFGYFFQKEVYKLFPRYKEINDNTKRQCYTAPLSSLLMSKLNSKSPTIEKIKEDFTNIVYKLSGNHENFSEFVAIEDIHSHPSDPSETAKWGMKSRYVWQNLIPLIFTNKETIEYRIFTVPDTVEKAFHFLIMSLAMTDYVIQKQSTILNSPEKGENLNFEYIFDYTLDDSQLMHYLHRDRKNIVTRYVNTEGAFFEEKDIMLPPRIFKNNLISSNINKMSTFGLIRETLVDEFNRLRTNNTEILQRESVVQQIHPTSSQRTIR